MVWRAQPTAWRRPSALPCRPRTPTPASAATIPAPAVAARSSRSATGPPKCGMRNAECGMAMGDRSRHDGRPDIPHSALPTPHFFGAGISPVGIYISPMPLRLSEHPEHDRPRERLWSVGPAALTGQELVAILLGTGCSGRDALAVAGEVLARVDGSLRRPAARPSAEAAKGPGARRGKAARAAAALELGRRVGTETEPPPGRIRGPADVQRFYGTRLRDLAVEEFHVLALGSQSQILGDLLITRGILNSSLGHPRRGFPS